MNKKNVGFPDTNIFEVLVAFFLFFLPFQFALHPTEGVDLAIVRVLAIGIFFCFAARSLMSGSVLLPRPLPLFFFVAFLFWSLSSFVWAENIEWAFRKSAFLLSFFPLFLVFFILLQKPHFQERAFGTLVIGVALSAFLAILVFVSQYIFSTETVFSFWIHTILPFFLGPTFGEAVASYPSLLVNVSGNTILRASLFFPDPHIAAFFFGIALPIALFFTWKSAGRFRVYWAVGATLILLADLLTFSRGGYIGLFCGVGIFALAPLFRYGIQKKEAAYVIVAGMFIGVALLASPVGSRFLSSFSQGDGSATERVRLWKEAGAGVFSHPFLGVGLGNYPLAVKPSAGYREPIYAHNLFLDTAVETGLPGVFFFSALLFLSALSLWRRWWKEASLLHLALFSSLVIFSVHSLFENPLFSVHILPIVLLLMASSFVPSRASAAIHTRA